LAKNFCIVVEITLLVLQCEFSLSLSCSAPCGTGKITIAGPQPGAGQLGNCRNFQKHVYLLGITTSYNHSPPKISADCCPARWIPYWLRPSTPAELYVDYPADCDSFQKCNPIMTLSSPTIRPSILNHDRKLRNY